MAVREIGDRTSRYIVVRLLGVVRIAFGAKFLATRLLRTSLGFFVAVVGWRIGRIRILYFYSGLAFDDQLFSKLNNNINTYDIKEKGMNSNDLIRLIWSTLLGALFGTMIGLLMLSIIGCGTERDPRQVTVVAPTPTPKIKEVPGELLYIGSACNGVDVFRVGRRGQIFAVYGSRLFLLNRDFVTIWTASNNRRCKLKFERGRIEENYKN